MQNSSKKMQQTYLSHKDGRTGDHLIPCSRQSSSSTPLELSCRNNFPSEYLPCAAQAFVVLCWLFPHELAEQLFPLSEQPLLCITRHLWYPEVQEEICQAVCANQRAVIEGKKEKNSNPKHTLERLLQDFKDYIKLKVNDFRAILEVSGKQVF